MTLTPAQNAALESVAAQIGVPAFTLDALILFETGGTYSPTIKNPVSSGRGLIQIIDATARGLGFSSSLDLVTRHPDFVSQINGPVLSYLKKGMPYKSDVDFFMQVFRPAARGFPVTTPFPDSVTAVNPGIFTPQDYADKLYSFLPIGKTFSLDAIEIKADAGLGLPFWIWGLAGVGLAFAITKKKKRRKK